MKATLEFTLPDEEAEFEVALHAEGYRRIVEEIDNALRRKIKYNDKLSEETINELEEIRTLLYNELNEANLILFK